MDGLHQLAIAPCCAPPRPPRTLRSPPPSPPRAPWDSWPMSGALSWGYLGFGPQWRVVMSRQIPAAAARRPLLPAPFRTAEPFAWGCLLGTHWTLWGGSAAPLQFPHSVGCGAPGTGPAMLGSDAASTCNPASPRVQAIGPGPAAGGHGGQQLEMGVGAGGDCAPVKGRGVLKLVAPECPGAVRLEVRLRRSGPLLAPSLPPRPPPARSVYGPFD